MVRSEQLRACQHSTLGEVKTLKKLVEEKNDEKLLKGIRGKDLFACKVKFHKTCRVGYMQNPARWRSKDKVKKAMQQKMKDANDQAFSSIKSIIEEHVLGKCEVVKLTDWQPF